MKGKNDILKGVICFVMALLVIGGSLTAYLLLKNTPDHNDAGTVCAVIAVFLGGGLITAGVKFMGVDFNAWD